MHDSSSLLALSPGGNLYWIGPTMTVSPTSGATESEPAATEGVLPTEFAPVIAGFRQSTAAGCFALLTGRFPGGLPPELA